MQCACKCLVGEHTAQPPRCCFLPADASGMWQVRVLPGPNAEPDYFTEEDMKTFYSATYSVHYNS